MTGWWGMACFNALSAEQQARLLEVGNLPWGYRPEGTECSSGAEIAIETQHDYAPGSRFYCLPCAIAYLKTLYTEREQEKGKPQWVE